MSEEKKRSGRIAEVLVNSWKHLEVLVNRCKNLEAPIIITMIISTAKSDISGS